MYINACLRMRCITAISELESVVYKNCHFAHFALKTYPVNSRVHTKNNFDIITIIILLTCLAELILLLPLLDLYNRIILSQ